jgi:hypothetical protein
MTRVALPLLLFGALAALAYAPAPPPPAERAVAPADTEWAWPEHAENLQVLPDAIGAEGLRNVMRAFTQSLGVRCSHCHVGEGDFLNWDFASDANPHKEIAREMMRMTRQINVDLLDDIEGLHHPVDAEAGMAGMRVTCWTCHRGQAEPEVHPVEPGEAPAPGAHPPGHPPGEHPPGHDGGHGAPPPDSSGHGGDGHAHPPGQGHD